MLEPPRRGTEGWAEVSRARKREIIDAIAAGSATSGPAHAELDLNDRCNVACYFCNQQDTRTSSQVPLEQAVDLIDEMVSTGLRSVRLSGGGDPLFHRQILDVLDHLAARQVVVDNLTTNAVGLSEEVAQRLVENRAREVIVSLNAVDGEDYHRMMRVKPSFFDQVIDNVRRLIQLRGAAGWPVVVIQFLLDRHNVGRLVEMYELGRSLDPDRIAINAVLEIPRQRIGGELLLAAEDRERARPLLEEILRRDLDRKQLQIDFPIPEWKEMLVQARAATGYEPVDLFPIAPTFKDANGGCFFAWYSAAITGNGDIHPCCLLIHPDQKPLGNINQSSFKEHWHGPRFDKMRGEMRDVLLEGGNTAWDPQRFEILQRQCVEPHLCWLKNIYFRGDETFYSELDAALEQAAGEARREPRSRSGARELKRRVHSLLDRLPFLRRPWDLLRHRSRPLRLWLARRTGLPLTENL